MKRNEFLIQWVLYSSFGELLGFGFAALSGFFIASVLGCEDIMLNQSPWLPILIMVVAGFVEGCILGIIQAVPLLKAFPLVSKLRWTILTGTGGAIAWGIGTLVGPLLSEKYFTNISFVSVLVAISMLVVLAGILGITQWIELKKHFTDSWKWIVYTIVGWGIGLSISFIGTSTITENTPIMWTIPISLLSGFLMGAAASFVTGLYLRVKLAEA